MRCQDVRDDLELLVLGALPAARGLEIQVHLESCPACREAERETRRLVRDLRCASAEAPRPEFERRLRSALAQAIRTQRAATRRTRTALAAGALAAGLILAAAAWLALRRPSRAGPQLAGVAERWRYGQVQATPASTGDGVVVCGRTMYLLRTEPGGSRVVAVGAATGSVRWISPCTSLGYLAADGQRVYCLAPAPRGTVTLLALHASDGREAWSYEQPQRHRLSQPSHPVPLPGRRVCWSAGGAVHVLDAATGTPRWTRPLPGAGPLSAPVACKEDLFVASRTALHCLAMPTGNELWRQALDGAAGPGRPVLAVHGGRAYVLRSPLATGAELACVGLAERALRWRRPAPGARCLVATGHVVCLRGGPITALDAGTGDQLWTRPASGCGPLTHSGGLIHYADSGEEGRLVALEPRTGRRVWELPGIRSCGALARVGKLSYIKTRDGVVHALALGPNRL